MDRRDRGLQLEAADVPAREHPLEDAHALGDQARVPAEPVLLGQRNQVAPGVGPGRLARLGQQHQRERAGDLVVAGEVALELAREADRLPGQRPVDQRVARAARVALVEDQVQDVEYGRDPVG